MGRCLLVLVVLFSLFFVGCTTFSIGSSYQSFTRWNTNSEDCWYYTGICDSIHTEVVDDKYCSYREYEREYKVISSIDQSLLVRDHSGSCTGTPGTTSKAQDSNHDGVFGGEGDHCTTATDCGMVCKGKPTAYLPYCIGDSRSAGTCFCQDGNGWYAGVCGDDTDCKSGEKCTSGLCTEQATGSGNPAPVTPVEICKIINCNAKCNDGTKANTCSTRNPGKYCLSHDEKQREVELIQWGAMCGCPDGQRADTEGFACCTPPHCIKCENGETQTVTCPDGTEIVTAECDDGVWARNSAVCSIIVREENTDGNLLPFMIGGIVVAAFMFVVGIILVTKRK